jgi:hypothetical protein
MTSCTFSSLIYNLKNYSPINNDLKNPLLIGTEGSSTPAGNAGQVRPHRAKPEEAHRQPRGKRAACSGNQHAVAHI